MIAFIHFGTKQLGKFQLDRYASDNKLAVQLMSQTEDGKFLEPYATLSVCTDHTLESEDEFVAKEYSENEGIMQQFIDAGYFEETGRTVQFGYVSGRILRLLPKAKEMTS
jgi:hypothetical protein